MSLPLVAGLAIFVATLLLIMIRPRGLSEAWAALGGSAAMLLTGLATPGQAVDLLIANLNVFGFFLGLMAISALADSAGVFAWLAGLAGRSARGSARRLFVNVFLVGVLITVFLSNDATALILTPLVYTLVVRLRLPPLPFMYATINISWLVATKKGTSRPPNDSDAIKTQPSCFRSCRVRCWLPRISVGTCSIWATTCSNVWIT